MAPRRIGYLTPLYDDSGSCFDVGERFLTDLATGVAESSGGRYEVEVISFSRAPGFRRLAPGVTLRLLAPSGRPKNPLDVVSWELPGAIAGVDLLHIHQVYNRCAEVGLFVAGQQRKPVCVTDHGTPSSPLVKQLGLLDMVDRVIACTDFGASLYRTSAPITVIKGGVDATRLTPSPAPVDRDRVVYVGGLLPQDGIDRLIEALPSELPLTVCGRPTHAPYYERLLALSSGKRVQFVTDAEDAVVLDLYRRALVHVVPSVGVDCYGDVPEAREMIGSTLLEANACGTAAICSRVASASEYVVEGVTGFVFDDLPGLTDRLRTLAREPGLADRLGHEGRRVVERDYDSRVAGAKLLAVYESLIGVSTASELAA